jgi:eukaryotic-like serine/threonine-protein kinase
MVKVMREVPSPLPVTEKPGDRIGCYKLLEALGEGGCGVVYMAEQEGPVRRKVALKVIKLGMDTNEVVGRFEAERQALALMDHPNIARVFDAGATDTGRPYFVMELVRGIRITDYCDQNQLSTPARLELFIQVCQAIQHAHQKGIIHRDLKPSNILVAQHDTVAVPKVIDFGIAKATSDQQLTDRTLFTAFEQFMGTPAYMSPEQAQLSGLDIDTRTDIYSLGVLLYELLTGRTPFDARELINSGVEAMRKTICEKEPVRPSTRQRQTALAAAEPNPQSSILNSQSSIDPDLDWIVMKCLEKDRSRRYETANGLAADLKRHLDNEPVVARPPGMAYRFSKLVRRNKLAFASAVAVTISLVLGTLVSTWQAYEAGNASDGEMQERQRAEGGESVARQRGYASDMNLAHKAVQEDELSLALELLNRQRPGGNSGIRIPNPEMEVDLRGWEWRYLWRQCQGDKRRILGKHTGGATAVGMLADGKTVFSAGRDKCVRLWDLESGSQIGLLPHEEEVIGAAASLDGRWLATASGKRDEGQPVLLWDLSTKKSVTLTSEYWLRPGSITFSPDSRWLAFATKSYGVRLWDLNARREVENLPPSSTSIWNWPVGIAFSPDSRTLAYNENLDGAILLWDILEGSVCRLKGHDDAVMALAFSPDGQTLASGSHDRTARLWNPADRQLRYSYLNPRGGITSLAFSPDGRTLAMSGEGGAGRVIRIVDVATGEKKAERRGHLSHIASLAFTPDGQSLLSASEGGSTIPFTPDGQSLLSASAGGGTIRVWDAGPGAREESGHVFARKSIRSDWPSNETGLCLSPDGLHLLAAYTNQTFSVWDTLSLTEGKPHPLPQPDTTIAAVAPGGCLAAFGNPRGEMLLWDLKTDGPRFSAQPGTNRIHRLAFSMDGHYLAAADNVMTRAGGNSSSTVRVWDVGAGTEAHVFPNGGELLLSLTFSADSRALMGGFWSGGAVKLWPLGRQGEPATFQKVSGFGMPGLALLPDGNTLVSAAEDIRFWDVNTRRENPGSVSLEESEYHSLALSPDGRRVACGTGDGRITIRDVASRHEVAKLDWHKEWVTQLAFTPDGNNLVSVSRDQLRVWRAASWTEIEEAEEAGK